MQIHYFQRYHSKENVDTSNTMLMLSRLYNYNADKFFSMLNSLILGEDESPEITFDLQVVGDDSVPDAVISQKSFKIVVETYLRYTFNNYSNIDEGKSNSDKKQIGKSTSKHTLPSQMKMRFSYQTDDGKKYKTDFVTCYSSSYVRYTGAKTYLVGLGYTENAKNSIKITFDKPGIYDLSDIEVFEQPIDQASQQIADLKADTMQNVKMGKNKITGTIDLQKAKMLCISIPYSKGWSATVDGKKAELLQADTAFSALALDKGKHTIEFQYHTPYLKEGARAKVCVVHQNELYLVKFALPNDDFSVILWEKTLLDLAHLAGVKVPKSRLVALKNGQKALMIKRFDRINSARLPFLSASM